MGCITSKKSAKEYKKIADAEPQVPMPPDYLRCSHISSNGRCENFADDTIYCPQHTCIYDHTLGLCKQVLPGKRTCFLHSTYDARSLLVRNTISVKMMLYQSSSCIYPECAEPIATQLDTFCSKHKCQVYDCINNCDCPQHRCIVFGCRRNVLASGGKTGTATVCWRHSG